MNHSVFTVHLRDNQSELRKSYVCGSRHFQHDPDVRRLSEIVERFRGEERLLNSQNAQTRKQSYRSRYHII